MEEMYHLCNKHMNRRVRLHTRCGCYEGVIVGVDRENVYLRTSDGLRLSGKAHTSAWGFGGGGEILTLSLFTLLALALI
ncbi:hypothetical protein [Cohnella mopanensis]|uniref:hypothetical protein n=1 Tax=Cohnella mopanensis TaxID=2911966 RepID=UPI001EF8BBFB|nr:hypothetical protein [Cohnella mopanensis]